MKEQLLFICDNKSTKCTFCYHAKPHPFDNDVDGGCLVPTCAGSPAKCKPININRRTAKQFAKIAVERVLKNKT